MMSKLKLIEDSLFSLDSLEIHRLAEDNIYINNVLTGYQKKAFHVRGINYELELIYIGETQTFEVTGYELRCNFDSENYVKILLEFCFFLANKFPLENPLHIYNTYIDLTRGILVKQNIDVITTADLDFLKDKYGTGTLLMKVPSVYLPTFKEIDFYRSLFGFNYTSFHPGEGKKYVYLIYNGNNGYFKIGRSKNPLSREKTLQAEEPDIALLKIWEKDGRFEMFLHKRFHQLRKRGEWFSLTFKELYEIKNLYAD